MNLQEQYIQKYNSPSDINEHLPVIYKLASKVNHVTEFHTHSHRDSHHATHISLS